MPTACPRIFLGEMNGIYYYIGQRCDTCEQVSLDGDREHTIDGFCQNCGGTGCSDPFSSNPHGFHLTEGLAQPVPPWDHNGLPGQSQDPRGRFSPGEDAKVVREYQATFSHDGKDHRTRLLVVDYSDPVVSAGRVGIGQELGEASLPGFLAAIRVDGEGQYHRIVLQGIDVIFNVLTLQGG